MACKDCVTGTLHTGTPTGEITTLHGLPTYIASSPEPKVTIVIIPDAFGWSFNNNRILADSYAQKGPFRVLLPDLMDGAGMEPAVLGHMDTFLAPQTTWGVHTLWKGVSLIKALGLFIPWQIKCGIPKTHPRVVEFMKQVRTEVGKDGKVGIAGFCWGGKHVFLIAAETHGEGLVDAGFAAHPSFLSLPKDIDAVKVPLSVALAENDNQLKGEKIKIVEKGLGKIEATCEVKVYKDATHGFAVRANPHVPKENEQGIEAEDQAIAWFTKLLL